MNYNTISDSLDTAPGVFICTWELGRRCNFDCTYCGDDSHDNFSQHASLQQLKQTVDFIYSYAKLIMSKRVNKEISINLTGGEPTVNPWFTELGDYLRERIAASSIEGVKITSTVTTNGSFSKRIRDSIVKNFDGATISYHCDSAKEMREKVIENIVWLHENKFRLKTNIMFHHREDLFKECVEVESFLRQKGVRSVPRIINGFTYSTEQVNWFSDYWNESSLKVEKKEKTSEENKKSEKDKFITGRHCCMKIPLTMTALNSSETKTTTYCGDTNFKGWKCGVNWKFLHIDQQRDEILHHQTCKANWGKTRGPIGKLSNWQSVIESLEKKLTQDTMEAIECTVSKCFCGVCAPKSYELQVFNSLMKKHVHGVEFESP